MPKTELIVQATFNYGLVTSDEAGKLQCLASEINRGKNKHAKVIIEIGESLAAAQDVLSKHGDGTFQKWVAAECGFGKSTAYNYMAAYHEFGDCPTVGQIEPGAMYALAENQKAKKQALKLADKGVKVTQAIAKQLVKEATATYIDEPAAEPETVEHDEVKCTRCGGAGVLQPDGIMPESLAASEAFVNVWQDYVQHRTQNRKPLTTVGIARLFAKLDEFGPDKAIRALGLSIENGWSGVFDPDDRKGNASRRSMTLTEEQANL